MFKNFSETEPKILKLAAVFKSTAI